MSACRSFTIRSVRRNGGLSGRRLRSKREMRYEQISKRPKGLKRILKKICSRASTPSSPQEAAG